VRPDRILVVDDNPITRKLMQVVLATEGFEVTAIGRAGEVDEAIRTRTPDLVLLDLVLPDGTGFDVLDGIRATHAMGSVPVIAVTGLADEDRILGAGFTDHLLKPIEPTCLVDRVRLHLRAVREPGWGTRRVLVVDDNAVQLKIVQLSLGCLGFQVSTARGAFEALAIARDTRPHVIVSDIVMPGVDGFQLCREIRRDAQLTAIPVVLASSRELDRADRDLGMRAGATAIVSRTADLAELTAAVREHAATSVSAPPVARPELPSSIHREVVANLEQQAGREAQAAHASQLWKAILVVLDRISTVIDAPYDAGQILDEIVAGLLDASGFSFGLSYTYDGARFELRSQLGFPPSSQPEISEFFGRPDLLQRVLDGRHPVALDEACADHTTDDVLARARVGSMLLVPLVRCAERIGVIVLASLNTAVSPDWLDLAKAVSWPIAQKIAQTIARAPDSEQRFRQIIESLGDGLVVANASHTVIYANPAAERILGCAAADIIGLPVSTHLSITASEPEPDTIRLSRPVGRLAIDVLVRPLVHDSGSMLYTLRDLTERIQIPAFAHLVNRDPLTRLFNRHRFDEALGSRLAEAQRYKRCGALLLLELDGLQAINERFGHEAGDAVLRRTGDVLVGITRDSDIRARLTGGKIALLLPHATSEAGERCARKLVAQLASSPITFNGAEIAIHASVGVAAFPDHGMSPQDIVAAADSAQYRAKRGGGARVCVHKVDDVILRLSDETEPHNGCTG
jgi:diguanylate cyclase (GGDEF)-like protein/PAS domain S-box-containing protein